MEDMQLTQHKLHNSMSIHQQTGILAGLMVLFAVAALAIQQVTLISPKARSIVYGTITIQAKPIDETGMNYVLLLCDKKGRSVSNTLPIRFELDTTQMENGSHLLQVDVYDKFGNVSSSQPVPIMVLNRPGDAFGMPAVPSIIPKKTTSPLAKKPPVSTNPPKNVIVDNSDNAQFTTLAGTTIKPTATSTEQKDFIPISGNGKKLKVLLDGKPLVMECDPFIASGHTMVLLRSLVEKAGGKLNWQGEHGQTIIDGREIQFTLNSPQALMDGEVVELDVPLSQIKDRVYGPVTIWRVIVSGNVGYDETPRTVWLRSPQSIASSNVPAK
jgi:hypothetical protein